MSGTGFADLGLAPALVRAAAAAGWITPSAIQAAALPPALQGRDVFGVAPTGTGKTAAFLLPLLQRVMPTPGAADDRPRGVRLPVRALVLAPTRELAAQTAHTAGLLAPGLRTVLAVGGLSINPQMMALRGGAHLVVATPGRLLDLVAHRALDLAALQVLVLDEADRLLDLGFADEVHRILALLPARRQTLMFSATAPEDVAALALTAMHDGLQVEVAAGPANAGIGVVAEAVAHALADTHADTNAETDADTDGPAGAAPAIHQRAIVVDTARRTALLRHLIASGRWQRVLVFVATQYASEHVADKLRQAGVPAAALHGRLSSGRRIQALVDLQAGRLSVLVATDLAARGLHIDGLDVVVNHELPRSAVDHLHRIGRTGRAGAEGQAISFIAADAPGSEAHFRLIEKRQRQRVPREQVAGFEPAATPLPTPSSAGGAARTPADAPGTAPGATTGGVKGRRKSKKDKRREAAAVLPPG